jgi:fermentation-respiration switch protein FrsA (DUF1100 family)
MTASAAAIIVFAILLVMAWIFQRKLIYFPFGDVPSPAVLGLPDVEEVSFPTADGLTLRGWFFPARSSPRPVTVLVCNGNGGNRAYRASLGMALRTRGFSVLLFDYRGYGGNPGSPSEAGLAADALAARAYLLQRGDVDAAGLVYFGESLGAAVAVTLALVHPPAALILRSPFTSLATVGQWHYPILPVGWLLSDRFDSIDKISSVRSPLLIVAGDRDRVSPFAHSQRLYEAASPPKEFIVVSGADHNDGALAEGPEVMEAIAQMLGRPGQSRSGM